MYTQFGDFSLKKEPRNAKRARLITQSIIRILIGQNLHILATFYNDPRKIMDVGALAVMFNVENAQKISKVFLEIMKNPGTHVDKHL